MLTKQVLGGHHATSLGALVVAVTTLEENGYSCRHNTSAFVRNGSVMMSLNLPGGSTLQWVSKQTLLWMVPPVECVLMKFRCILNV